MASTLLSGMVRMCARHSTLYRLIIALCHWHAEVSRELHHGIPQRLQRLAIPDVPYLTHAHRVVTGHGGEVGPLQLCAYTFYGVYLSFGHGREDRGKKFHAQLVS
jgi:hypothetical protein